MIDVLSNTPLHVSTDGASGPYIVVPLTQLEEVEQLLDAHDVAYWADRVAVSLDRKPFLIVVNLGHAADVAEVQNILDGAG